jgi:molybdate transport system substrate-binding protein
VSAKLPRFALVALVLCVATRAGADSVHIAVATNFAATCRAIGDAFTAASQHDVLISEGSSGKLAAQIANGAPFEVFLSADARRPAKLEAEQHAVAGTRFVYALGRLALWSTRPEYVQGEATLRDAAFRHLAIANPALAPYGVAARDVLQHLQLWDRLTPKLVRGEDVGQTYHFIATGNAQLGFVALAQIAAHDHGSRWLVPPSLYAPIEQQAVLLAPGREDPAARAFLDFLKSAPARALIEAAGYGVPSAP